jgi:hypothetical protein
VEHPPISSSSDNVPVNSDFFIPFLPYGVAWGKTLPTQTIAHVLHVTQGVRGGAVPIRTVVEQAETSKVETSPLHGRHALQ